jgi:hypothetical protein
MFQDRIPNDGNGSFESMATQKILTELKTLLTQEDEKPQQPDKSSHFDSATGKRWQNHSQLYNNALILIEMIDPQKGSINADYMKPLLTLFTQKFNNGMFHGLETVFTLCQYSIMDLSHQKQLIVSFLAGANYWLDRNHWSYSQKSLDFITRILNGSHHPEIVHSLQVIQSLISKRSWKPLGPEYGDPLILNKVDQLEHHIRDQLLLHFTPMESNENSW